MVFFLQLILINELKKKQILEERKLKQLQSDYKITFGSDEGKRVLEDISKRCHEFNTTHCKGDSHESACFEGQRSIMVFIKSILKSK